MTTPIAATFSNPYFNRRYHRCRIAAMQKAARIGSLVMAIVFAGALLRGLEFEQWVPLDVVALIASGVFAVGLLTKGQKAGWYYFIVSAALLAGVLTYQRLAFWIVLDLIVIGLNAALFFGFGAQRSPAARQGQSQPSGLAREAVARTSIAGEVAHLPREAPVPCSGSEEADRLETMKDLGTALRLSYSRMVDDMTESFMAPAREAGGPKMPSNLEFEVAALLYFAYDYAMSSGFETALRSVIRDQFIAIQPPSAAEASLIADRTDEYAAALRTSDDQMRALLHVGNVFATHVGHANNVLVAAQAGNMFKVTYQMVTQQVSDVLKRWG